MNTNPVATGFDIPEDDDAIAAALEDASIPTLMMSMIHMSGDASLLDGQIRPAGAYINEYQGYMTEEDKAAVRAQALEVIRAFRDGGCQLPTPPDRDTIHRMMNFLVAQEVPEEYVPMMLEEMELDGRDREVARDLLGEIRSRLSFLAEIDIPDAADLPSGVPLQADFPGQ